jgi:hypothetical protein
LESALESAKEVQLLEHNPGRWKNKSQQLCTATNAGRFPLGTNRYMPE